MKKTEGELSLGSAAGVNAETDLHGEADDLIASARRLLIDAHEWSDDTHHPNDAVIVASLLDRLTRAECLSDERMGCLQLVADALCSSIEGRPLTPEQEAGIGSAIRAVGRMRDAIDKLRQALFASMQFIEPGVDRGPASNGWQNTIDMVREALIESNSFAVDGGTPRTSTDPQSQATTANETPR